MCGAGAHSAHVTGVAEEVSVQGEALRAGLIREPLSTPLRKKEDADRERNINTGSEVRNPGCFTLKVRAEWVVALI